MLIRVVDVLLAIAIVPDSFIAIPTMFLRFETLYHLRAIRLSFIAMED
jgi:hypothetical protein